MSKKVCELCGYADDSYSIEENGTVMKVCKFCHDGYLERMGLPPDADKPISDVASMLDYESVKDEIGAAPSESRPKVEPLSEEELNKVLNGGKKRKPKPAPEIKEKEPEDDEIKEEVPAQAVSALSEAADILAEIESIIPTDGSEPPVFFAAKEEKPQDAKNAASAKEPAAEPETPESAAAVGEPEPAEKKTASGVPAAVNTPAVAEGARGSIVAVNESPAIDGYIEEEKRLPEKRKRDIMDEVNPKIDDERIKITSPEVPLSSDARPKTNLDVAVSEYKNSVKFMNAFKYVFHPIVYAILLGVVVATVATVLFIVKGWQAAVYVLGGGIIVIGLGYFLMWYLRTRYDKDKRAYLLRIRQQEILFESMNSDCYRELKTKFTVLKSLEWLLSKLSVLLPLLTILGGIVASVIVCFVYQVWLMPIILFGGIVGGIVVYWTVKFAADLVSYKLDAERNQQIQQQTLLDILDTLKK